MSDNNRDIELSLKVVINKEKGKVLFAEADNLFVGFLDFNFGKNSPNARDKLW